MGGNLVDEVSKQLKKGVIEILILKLLSLRNMYGYQLIQELDTKSNGIFKMKEGTLYPILYRLEDNNFIESYWEQDNEKRGVPRKYYKIAQSGLTELSSMVKEFSTLILGVNLILNLEDK
jgi:PadR family transcriptional regulator, regulatory protein PadR